MLFTVVACVHVEVYSNSLFSEDFSEVDQFNVETNCAALVAIGQRGVNFLVLFFFK
jgi:hypothetical protein